MVIKTLSKNLKSINQRTDNIPFFYIQYSKEENMIIDINYWTRVFKNILYVFLILLGLYISLKLSIFYMPFLIAFIISLIIEPIIKFLMNKTHLTRRSSSIIIFILVSLIILGGIRMDFSNFIFRIF